MAAAASGAVVVPVLEPVEVHAQCKGSLCCTRHFWACAHTWGWAEEVDNNSGKNAAALCTQDGCLALPRPLHSLALR